MKLKLMIFVLKSKTQMLTLKTNYQIESFILLYCVVKVTSEVTLFMEANHIQRRIGMKVMHNCDIYPVK